MNIRVLVAALLVWSVPILARAQVQPTSPCSTPPPPPAPADVNIFTPEQAAVLGDVVMKHVARAFNLVRDPALDAYAQRIADRMAAIAGSGPVRVELLDVPSVNAFTFAGGRVLVSRKLVAFARSEDELAGVLAHEFGHVAARDTERSFSNRLRRVLNVTAVTDARDIEEKYNRVIDNQARKPVKLGTRNSEEEQERADQFAVWLMARAGYDPQAYADVWDRFNELQANTGNWLSDLFGTTKPEAKRLRVTLRSAAALPANCRGTRPATEAEFAAWQRSVIEASRSHRAESLHGVVREKRLDPPVRSTVSRVRFSQDGRWVLTQDDSNIAVFARDGLVFSFRIDAPDAYVAQFTPDSAAVVFHDASYRVERWSLATRQREWVRDVPVNAACLQTALSPDGQWMTCSTTEFALRVFEVATGAMILEKAFYRVSLTDALQVLLYGAAASAGFFRMEYSPDAHYLVVARGLYSVAVDLTTRRTLGLPGSIRDRIGSSFSFLGNDRIVGSRNDKPADSGIVTFPGGQIVTKLNFGRRSVTAATHGDEYVILRAAGSGVFRVKDSTIVAAGRSHGLDVYDDLLAWERRTGELWLQKVGGTFPLHVAQVPAGLLARLRAADVSDDFGRLAISQASRGVVWDLKTGKAQVGRGFRSAFVDSDGSVYVDVPRENGIPRAVCRVDPETQRRESVVGIEAPNATTAQGDADEPEAAAEARPPATVTALDVEQHGQFLVGFRETAPKSDGRTLVVFDARTGRELWARPMGKSSKGIRAVQPRHHSLILMWAYSSEAARPVVEATPAIEQQFESMKAKKEEVGLLQVLDLATGTVRGHLLVNFGRGSFVPAMVVARGDHVVIGDNQNRTLVYSLASSTLLGRAFGTPLDVAVDANLICVQNTPGEVTIYSSPDMQELDKLVFPSGVAFARFSRDGNRLFVLTRDQTAYTIDLTIPGKG
jgi:hypothetical protein